MLKQRDQHLISRVARLRTGVESNRCRRQVRSERCNRPSHSGARRDAGDRRPLASRKAIVAALNNPVDLLQRSVVRQLAQLSRASVSSKQLAVHGMKRHAERIAKSRRNYGDGRIVDVNPQHARIVKPLSRPAGRRCASVRRRALPDVEKPVGTKLEAVGLVITFARQAVDYYRALVGDVIAVRIAQPDYSPSAPQRIACEIQIAVSAELET